MIEQLFASKGHLIWAMWLFLSVHVTQVGYDFGIIFQMTVCCEYEPNTTSSIFGKSPIDSKGLSFFCDVWWALQPHVSVFIPEYKLFKTRIGRKKTNLSQTCKILGFNLDSKTSCWYSYIQKINKNQRKKYRRFW